jgi:ATP-dependent exoDNAse (exonuclease V) beta subunit
VCIDIVERKYPWHTLSELSFSSDTLERICWKVFALLRLSPITDNSSKWKTLRAYHPFRLPDTFWEEWYLVTSHNRVWKISYERLQETYDSFIKTHAGYLQERYNLLEDFMLARTPDTYEALLPHIEQCCQKISELRKDIVYFCDKNQGSRVVDYFL